MGSFKHHQKRRRRPSGKIDSPLNEKLKNVKWGEFRLGELFVSSNGDFDIQKTHINGKGDYVITAGLTDNGVLGKTDIKAKVFDAKTITIDMFGWAFYRQFKYKMVTHARVFSLKPLFEISENQGIYLACSLGFLRFLFGYENMCSWEKIKNITIHLPLTQTSEIDFDFMESFIRELEEERISELEAYLAATGLKDYTLTDEEQNALEVFKTMQWGEFRIGDLFEKIDTRKLPYKAADLPTTPTNEYQLPCLTSSFHNQGLNYYAPKENATILRNVISIPSNSDVYRAYFQSRDFTVLSDAYAIKKKNCEIDFSAQHYLFCVMCINKVTDLPLYSYKTKLGGWNVVQDKIIQLPTKDDKPDYATMETFIKAVEKLVIKDVVLYADSKIRAIKKVVKENEYKSSSDYGLLNVAQP